MRTIILVILISIMLSGCAVQPVLPASAVLPNNYPIPAAEDVYPLFSGTTRQIILNVMSQAPLTRIWQQGSRVVLAEMRNSNWYFVVLDARQWKWISSRQELCGNVSNCETFGEFIKWVEQTMKYQPSKFADLGPGVKNYLTALLQRADPTTVIKVGAAGGAAAEAAASRANPSMWIMTFMVNALYSATIQEYFPEPVQQ